jgi:hypothetical protein
VYQLLEIPKELQFVAERIRQTFPPRISSGPLEIDVIGA